MYLIKFNDGEIKKDIYNNNVCFKSESDAWDFINESLDDSYSIGFYNYATELECAVVVNEGIENESN